MTIRARTMLCALALSAALLSAGPAAASRATCDELLRELDVGRTAEDVMQDHRTTRARLDVCVRIARQAERLSEQRDRFELRRAERGLPH